MATTPFLGLDLITSGDVNWANRNNGNYIAIDGFLSKVSFVFNQGVPAVTWTVIHNLGRMPSVTIIDSSHREVKGEVVHDSINQCTLKFSAPFSGLAYLT